MVQMVEFPTFMGSGLIGSGHGHYLFSSFMSTTCIPNFIEIEETFCGRTDGNLPPIVLGRLPNFGSRPKNPGGSLQLPSVIALAFMWLCH